LKSAMERIPASLQVKIFLEVRYRTASASDTSWHRLDHRDWHHRDGLRLSLEIGAHGEPQERNPSESESELEGRLFVLWATL
jgi:hypothetical protein